MPYSLQSLSVCHQGFNAIREGFRFARRDRKGIAPISQDLAICRTLTHNDWTLTGQKLERLSRDYSAGLGNGPKVAGQTKMGASDPSGQLAIWDPSGELDA
jgi:hypothetical protein